MILPEAHKEYVGDIELISDPLLYSITGTLVSLPPHGIGRIGDEVNFFYTAWNDPVEIGHFIVVPYEIIYRIGESMVNDWCFVYGQDLPEASIVQCNELSSGTKVIVSERLTHKLVPEGVSSDPLYAVRYDDILMIEK